MKKTYLILAVLAIAIFYLFKNKTSAAANPLAFPSTLPLPPSSNLGVSLSTLPPTTPTYTAAPQGPTQSGSWIGGPPSNAVQQVPYTYSGPSLGDAAPAESIAPDLTAGTVFFS